MYAPTNIALNGTVPPCSGPEMSDQLDGPWVVPGDQLDGPWVVPGYMSLSENGAPLNPVVSENPFPVENRYFGGIYHGTLHFAIFSRQAHKMAYNALANQ